MSDSGGGSRLRHHLADASGLPGARRTEFLADTMAARVASTTVAVSALRGREFADAVNAGVHRRAVALRTFRGPDAAATGSGCPVLKP